VTVGEVPSEVAGTCEDCGLPARQLVELPDEQGRMLADYVGPSPSSPRLDSNPVIDLDVEQPTTREELIASLTYETKTRIAGEVGETFTYTGDRKFQGRVQVAALGTPQSRFMKLNFFCQKIDRGSSCGSLEQLDFADQTHASAFATYFDTNNPIDALKVLAEAEPIGNDCGHSWRYWGYKGREERAVTQAIVLDLGGNEGKAWFVHGPRCDLSRAPNWIIADGWICRGKMGKVGVLIGGFTSQSEVSKPKPEDVEKARTYLRSLVIDNGSLADSVVWRISQALARRGQLKGPEVVRGFVSDLLTDASPAWVKTPEGPPQLGATTCELGPTTAAKSQRERMLIDFLECGKYVTGRLTVAGLTAGAEKMEGGGWILRKGLLPSMDLSWLVVDNIPPHALDSQIESRRDGVVTINAIRNAELWARVRLKLLSNPSQPFDETLYKCTLLKSYDPKLIARFCFAIYTYGVSIDDRYDSTLAQPLPNDDQLLAAAKTVLRTNLSTETIFTVPRALWKRIMEYGKTLEEKYGCEDIPLLLRSVPYKLALLAYSFMLLEGYEEPTQRHLTLAHEWLDETAKDIELDKYVEYWKSQHALSEEDYRLAAEQIESAIKSDLKEHGGTRDETYTFSLVEYLAKNETAQRDEIASYLNVEAKTVTRKANLLKGLGLLRSDMEGYHFTAKGVRFFKRWLADVPNVSNDSTFEGKPPSGDPTLALETGVSKDIRDIKNGRSTEKTSAFTFADGTLPGSTEILSKIITPKQVVQLKEKVLRCFREQSEKSFLTAPTITYFVGAKVEHVEPVLTSLEREGLVFQTRPGYWRLTR
jgi:hypothetical protein